MGIANRDYYRDTAPPAWTMGNAPATKYLIIATVVVFLLQIFSTRDEKKTPREVIDEIKQRDPDFDPDRHGVDVDKLPSVTVRVSYVTEWLDLNPTKVLKGQVWRIITHAFCHSPTDLLHILFNMLFLFWFGREVESIYGSREFLLFYLAAAVVAGLAYIGLDLATGDSTPAVGASGAVLGVTMLFTLHYPRHIINLFMIIPIEMRWFILLVLAMDLHPVLLNLSGSNVQTGIGHAAHLGGLAFGFCYYRFQWRLDRFVPGRPRIRRASSFRPRLRIAPGTASEPPPMGNVLDRILEKISRTGQESLTAEERETLRAESERIRRRTRPTGEYF
jgi:membrane associated rhomboid family serine protease